MASKKKPKTEQKPVAPEAQTVVATQPAAAPTVPQQRPHKSAMVTLSDRMGVEPTTMFMASLRNVAFKSPDVSEEQLMALVVVANQYKLNPFTRELYAFPDRNGGIVPIVSVDGWFRIINEQPALDGIEYREIHDEKTGDLIAGEVTIHRKDRRVPTTIRETLAEVRRSTDPWKQHTSRMLRHKTIIQGARVAFGFAGIYEPDEGERVLQAQRVVPVQAGTDGVRTILEQEPPKANGKPQGDPEKAIEDGREAERESQEQRDRDAGLEGDLFGAADNDDDDQERMPV